ncbi:tetratricopeptide repeat domain protein [Halomicronema hongdechloris C2206]|uniref:Tetratricopeptide repeat domain protein n=2 Tax=Halomicronema hongdechloris TaxID=1209493 RepID=A0A1Z3HUT8_9CYAN|nr:tetratricopeptide repeat domain protein [Halomicronema hongdechloris C2206]
MVQAQIYDVQGQLQFSQGELEAALESWQRSEAAYKQAGDVQRQMLSRIHQVQVFRAKGLYRRVLLTLQELQAFLQDQPDSIAKVQTLQWLGDAFRTNGNLAEAEDILRRSLALAAELNLPEQVAAAQLSLGNLEQSRFVVAFDQRQGRAALDHANAALQAYRAAAAMNTAAIAAQARLNTLALLTSPTIAQWTSALQFYPSVEVSLSQLPPGRPAIYGHVKLADSLITLKQNTQTQTPPWQDIEALLLTAQAQAEDLGDMRSHSFVLGTLGKLYEQRAHWRSAEQFSRQALALSQALRADDISYRWQWQLGRIFKAQGYTQGAIGAYKQAFDSLRTLRNDLVAANPDVRFSFRESVEPVYRDLVDLLLTPVDGTIAHHKAHQSRISQTNLEQARTVMEALRIAELENFFQAACVETTVNIDQAVDQGDPTAAVVYSILLDDRLEVILKLPRQPALVHYASPVPQATLGNTLVQLRRNLQRGSLQGLTEVQTNGQTLYQWLLQPAVEQGYLSPETIKTLLFVLDGPLRLVPMAALHDGRDFLLRTYAMSLMLGLELRDPQPLPEPDDLSVLAAGLTTPPSEEANNYVPLPNVNVELDRIQAAGFSGTFIRDGAFTKATLQRDLMQDDYTIVHLATHGQFSGSRDSTYILAADGRVNIDELGRVFRRHQQSPEDRLELLILSACKTAEGDDRSALGIAGAAVQAGASSTIATLWSVDDEASVYFTETLYQHLGQPGVSRAEALRRAQVALFDRYGGRPRFWAPYVLVGSWR